MLYSQPFAQSPEQTILPRLAKEEFIMPRRTFDRSTSGIGNVIDMKTKKPVEKAVIPIICERIRCYRELAGMEQKEMAKALGITGNSISNWENGRSRPDINLIPALCELLHVTLYELFDMEDPTSSLTTGEQMHIDTYRQLSRGNQYAVDKLTDSLLTVQRAEECRNIRQLPFYDRKLAAGTGDPTEFEDRFTPLFLYADNIDSRADCVFGVNGNSMEPVYHNGDLVLVERIPGGADLKEGETGAFIIGNETYIKNLGKDGLHSLNPDYKTIRFHDNDIVYLIGRVLARLDPDKDIARQDDIEKYMAIHGDY